MNSRIRRIITARSASHLLLWLLLLTSQLLVAQSAENTAQTSAKSSNSVGMADEVTIKAREQVKQGNIYQLAGDVEIDYHGYVMRAEQVTYDSESGAVLATGSVVLDGGPHDAHLQAARANYNVKTESGTFYDVVGSFGTVVKGRTIVLTTNNPFTVTGRELRKVGRDRYIVYHGTITSCTLPSPKWNFEAEKIDLVAGEEAKMYHTTFRLRHIPVIYFPYAQHPLQNLGRQSGFVIPAIGQSSSKGFILGESFYWVINRSMDATIGTEYWSKRGWAQRGEFRARPSENSSLNVRLFSVLDRLNQGGQEVWLNGELTRGNWRTVANVDYLSSYTFRQVFTESYTQAANSEVISTAFASRNQNGYSLNVMAEKYQNFQNPQNGPAAEPSQIKIMHEPTLEASSVERKIANSPFTWSFDSSLDALARREPDFNTNPVVGRYDVYPRLALPLSWKGWDLRSEVAVRDTVYTQSQTLTPVTLLPTPHDASLNRGTFEGTLELRPPALAKVFQNEVHGLKLKHVIEPQVTYHYVTGVNQFQQTIRFDERDILADTNQVEYGITQRLYARRRESRADPRCEEQTQAIQARPGQYLPGTSAHPVRCEAPGANTREILSWEVKQRYYGNPTFGGAVITGQRNVFTATDDLTGIAFLTEPRRFSPIVSRLRVLTSVNTDMEWELDYDTKKGRINSSTALVDYRVGPIFFGASEAYLHVPEEPSANNSSGPTVFNQFRGLIGFGHPNKRGWSAGASLGYDQHLDYLQYAAVQTTYNWDCCGINLEYRRFAFPGVRNENVYRFTLTLANIGTFGNMRRSERLY